MCRGASPVGLVFDIKRYSIHDGPGIRTTFFLKGCPLSCWWCHNPEGMSPGPVLFIRRNRCIRCGRCIRACAFSALSLPEEGVSRDPEKCTMCLECVRVCPTMAIDIAGKPMTVDELMAEAEKDVPFYDESGGGVTFSGGEPLLQADFLLACLEACRRAEIRTAVDTSGYAEEDVILKAAELTDLFLFDVKTMDPAVHRNCTGVGNERILSNLRKADERFRVLGRGSISIRIPLLPGINDSQPNLEAVADLAASLHCLSGVAILPYHSIASGKYRDLGMPWRMPDTVPPSDEETQRAVEIFARRGIRAGKGG